VRADRSTLGSGENRSGAIGLDVMKVVFDITQKVWRQRECTYAGLSLWRTHPSAAGNVIDAALNCDLSVQQVEVSSL
jgi:hypothetical protein